MRAPPPRWATPCPRRTRSSPCGARASRARQGGASAATARGGTHRFAPRAAAPRPRSSSACTFWRICCSSSVVTSAAHTRKPETPTGPAAARRAGRAQGHTRASRTRGRSVPGAPGGCHRRRRAHRDHLHAQASQIVNVPLCPELGARAPAPRARREDSGENVRVRVDEVGVEAAIAVRARPGLQTPPKQRDGARARPRAGFSNSPIHT